MATPQWSPGLAFEQPAMRKQSEIILKHVRNWSETEVIKKFSVSAKIAKEAMDMFQQIQFPMQLPEASPAILTFSGDVYRGLDAKSFSDEQLKNAQGSLRILSGMYGYLKPLELIQPYRLMMGTAISDLHGYNSLSAFWKPHITAAINVEMNDTDIIVNLTSQEYSSVLDEKSIHAVVVRCDFREVKNGKAVSVSTYAKLARGLMARHIIIEKPKNRSGLKKFNAAGYSFNEALSDENNLIFTR